MQTATVEVRDLTSVVTLDGSVVASPQYAVASDVAGVVTFVGAATGGVVAWVKPARRPAHIVALPAGSRLTGKLVADGAQAAAGLPVLRAQHVGFAVQASIPATKLYRFYDGVGPMRAQIDQGPGPFDCAALGAPTSGAVAASAPAGLVTPAQAGSDVDRTTAPPVSGEMEQAGMASSGLGAAATVSCAAPSDVRLLPGAAAILAVTTGSVKQAASLPVEAVAGLSHRGMVAFDLGNGRTQARSVTLGLTDGRYVQVTEGLRPGDKVRTPAPDVAGR